MICDGREEDREQRNVAARDEKGKWTDCDCTAEKKKKIVREGRRGWKRRQLRL